MLFIKACFVDASLNLYFNESGLELGNVLSFWQPTVGWYTMRKLISPHPTLKPGEKT